jgi:hypothetical protein
MKNFSYTKTPSLNNQLIHIEDLRRELILKSLSPRTELQLQWSTTINYIHYLLGLHGNLVVQSTIQQLLSPVGKKQLASHEIAVVQIKSILDFLYHNWLVNPAPISAKNLVEIYENGFSGSLRISEKELDNALKYIQINPESPIIQASLAQFMMFDINPFSENNDIFAHIVFLLFLYKTGYDFRRMLVVEQFFYNNIAHYKDLITSLRRKNNITEWLEYVVEAILSQLTALDKTISIEKQSSSILPTNLVINTRQEAILKLMEQPGMKINNTTVQKMYKVSQITASRDLSKLTTLGLLFPLGKGRSTYYTKV